MPKDAKGRNYGWLQ